MAVKSCIGRLGNMNCGMVVVGASLGGLDTVGELLGLLPGTFRIPIAIVQHRSEDAKEMLIDLLQGHTRLSVREAEDKEPVVAGRVYVAPAGYHLLAEGDHFALSTEAPCNFARPSIDALFESAAWCYGEQTIGIILSGTGRDGAEGLKEIIKRGGQGIVESPMTAGHPEMPERALEANPGAKAMTVPDIAFYLEGLVGNRM